MEYLHFENCDVTQEQEPAPKLGAKDLLMALALSFVLLAIVAQLARTEAPMPKPETALIERWCKP